MKKQVFAVVIFLVVIALLGISARTVTGTPTFTIDEFPLLSDSAWPQDIAADAGGNLWFVQAGNDRIGRLVPAQATPGTSNGFTEFPLTQGAWPQGIDARGDVVWVAEYWFDGLAMVAGGTVTEYLSLDTDVHPTDVAIGHDGSIWFTESDGNALGRFWPITGTVEQFRLSTPNSYPLALTLDQDGSVWFATAASNEIGVFRPAEITMTLFAIPTAGSYPTSLIVDDQGIVWFTEGLGNKIGRLDPTTGMITEYPVPTPGGFPKGIALDNNGRLWFAENLADKIASFDMTTHVFTEYALPSSAVPEAVVASSDNVIWFTQGGLDRLGRLILDGSSTPTATVTPSATGTATATPTPTATPTASQTPTVTATPETSVTVTATATMTATPSATKTPTPSPTQTVEWSRRIYLPIIVSVY